MQQKLLLSFLKIKTKGTLALKKTKKREEKIKEKKETMICFDTLIFCSLTDSKERELMVEDIQPIPTQML